MKAKQLLLGISLLSILTACSDGFDEYPNSADQNSDIDKKSSKIVKEDSSSVTTNLFNRETGNLKTNTSQTSRTEQDSLYNKEIINETTTTAGTPISPGSGTEPETIDPTKPDRPK
ncbi:hypothetical protein MKJ01_18180 [Chryseobacterium sp. SSA4.19]|uniref:hypothetical protein n=1 Tax=Chryseobacterium sp. SSA4.19 TaxID=2919915 RepID=UPI001F4EF1F8|nr:hypothetical protein [Chryseobacterium sp. SSA4.19]MCJ8155686.1 hypothetical protein [Chryseobacterium sp. SSA4.19]